MTDAQRAEGIHTAMSLVFGRLTEAEQSSLLMLAKGLNRRAAGAMLGTTENTEADRRRTIYRKLEVNSAPEAAVLAAKAGLV